MRRMNNLITLFSAIFAFFFGCFLTTVLTNIDKCPTKLASKLDHTNDIFLIVLIVTAPNYFERRQAIRDTWLKLSNPLMQPYYPEDFIYLPHYDEKGFLMMEDVADQSNRLRIFMDWKESVENAVGSKRTFKVKTFFAIGSKGLTPALLKKLNDEHNSNQDILLLSDLHDSYNNLTQKLLLSIKTVTDRYSFNYILKSDDDTYVKLDFLINELVSYDRKLIRQTMEYSRKPLPELYWGYFNGRANIKNRGQWKEDHYFLCNRYASYALGGGYVISRGIAEYIATSSHLLNTYVSEDVSLGTWLAPLRNIYRRHDVRFDTGYMPRKCKHYHIALHKRSVDQMKDVYEKRLCTFETGNEMLMRRPIEYYYDWTKTPEKCCNDAVA